MYLCQAQSSLGTYKQSPSDAGQISLFVTLQGGYHLSTMNVRLLSGTRFWNVPVARIYLNHLRLVTL
jgi:hypothetical protein